MFRVTCRTKKHDVVSNPVHYHENSKLINYWNQDNSTNHNNGSRYFTLAIRYHINYTVNFNRQRDGIPMESESYYKFVKLNKLQIVFPTYQLKFFNSN